MDLQQWQGEVGRIGLTELSSLGRAKLPQPRLLHTQGEIGYRLNLCNQWLLK